MLGIFNRLQRPGSHLQLVIFRHGAGSYIQISPVKSLNRGFERTFSSFTCTNRTSSNPLYLLQCLSKLRCSVVQQTSKCVSRTQHILYTTRARFDMHKNLARDVLVYSHNNDNFYRILSYFGVFQMMMWGYVALFSFQQLKTIPVGVEDTTDLPWWKKFLYKEGQYKNSLSMICLIVGLSVLFITLTYPRRAVKSLWLIKGGNEVKITTYSWLGQTNTFRKPVEHLSCTEGRMGKGNHVPLKIKNTKFFFLLDKQGTFHNLDLFDFVVGLERKL